MRTSRIRRWSVLIALALVVLAAGTWLEAACKKTVSQSVITYTPAGETCVDGKTKLVCTGTACANAGSKEQGKLCCTDSTVTSSCNKYVGHDPWYQECHWDDAGIANGSTPSANLSGNDCTG